MIYEVDSNFLSICEKMQIFNFRQMYIISVSKIKSKIKIKNKKSNKYFTDKLFKFIYL